jgi:hypothetical protein
MAGVASRRLPLARLQRRLTIFFPSWSPRREDVCEAHGTWSLLTLLGTSLGAQRLASKRLRAIGGALV